jgi:hypothetical protein
MTDIALFVLVVGAVTLAFGVDLTALVMFTTRLRPRGDGPTH